MRLVLVLTALALVAAVVAFAPSASADPPQPKVPCVTSWCPVGPVCLPDQYCCPPTPDYCPAPPQ